MFSISPITTSRIAVPFDPATGKPVDWCGTKPPVSTKPDDWCGTKPPVPTPATPGDWCGTIPNSVAAQGALDAQRLLP